MKLTCSKVPCIQIDTPLLKSFFKPAGNTLLTPGGDNFECCADFAIRCVGIGSGLCGVTDSASETLIQ